jgi:hypothetical protein
VLFRSKKVLEKVLGSEYKETRKFLTKNNITTYRSHYYFEIKRIPRDGIYSKYQVTVFNRSKSKKKDLGTVMSLELAQHKVLDYDKEHKYFTEEDMR